VPFDADVERLWCENRGAFGAEGLGSEERRKLPQRSAGRSPGHQQFWCILGLKNDVGGT
jgi:hypothetical protein